MKVFDIVFTVLIPLVLLVAGWMMQFHPPKKQNAWIGYRTTRSMKMQKLGGLQILTAENAGASAVEFCC